MHDRRGQRRGGANAAAVLFLASCAQVLGLPADDEVAAVADTFCKCEDFAAAWPGEDCRTHVEGRLATAPEDVRRAWLDLFIAEDCRVCTNAEGRATCAGSAPLCVNTGGACGANDVCCLADGDDVYCGAQGVCVAEPAGCLESNSPCVAGVDTCCGEVGQLAACIGPTEENSRCVEVCDPTSSGNCAGCCARTSFIVDEMVSDPISLCLPSDNDCSQFCNLAGTGSCDDGRTCVPVRGVFSESSQDVVADICLPTCDPVQLGAPCGEGCCARVTDGEGTPVYACLPDSFTALCGRYCDAAAGTPCACGVNMQTEGCVCEPRPLTPGEALGYTVDRCVKAD